MGLFAAGAILLNPPILNLVGGRVFGWPALYLYLFVVWALLIVAIALVTESGSGQGGERDKEGGPR